MTLVTAILEDVGKASDDSTWIFYSSIRESSSGDSVITSKKVRRDPVDGVLSVELDPGPASVTHFGTTYNIDVPDVETISLWSLIAAAVAFPPGTPASVVGSAVDAWLDINPLDWGQVGDKPAFMAVGSTQAAARGAIGAAPIASPTFTGTVSGVSKSMVGLGSADNTSDANKPISTAQQAALDAKQRLLPTGYADYTTKPNGAVPNADSGQAVSVWGTDTATVVSGAVKHVPVGTSTTACYTQHPAGDGNRITRVQIEGFWPAGNVNSAVTIVVPEAAWGPVGGFPGGTAGAQALAGIHSTFFQNGIFLHSHWDIGAQTIYAHSDTAYSPYPALGRYAPIPDNTIVMFDMLIDNVLGTLTMFPPGGGKPHTVQNNAIRDHTGPWVIAEQFETSGTASGSSFQITAIRWDTQVRRKASHFATKADLAEAVPGLIAAGAIAVESTASAAGTKTLTSSSPSVQVITGSAAHTVQLAGATPPSGFTRVINATTGLVTVNAPNGSLINVLLTGEWIDCVPLTATPSAPGNFASTTYANTNIAQVLKLKRVDPRVSTITAAATTMTPSFATADVWIAAAQTANLTIANPGVSTPNHHQEMWFKDDGVSARTLTWNAVFDGSFGVALPTTTVLGKWTYVETVYNATLAKHVAVNVRQQT